MARGRPERQAGVRVARRARRPDALVRRHDRAALRGARAWSQRSVAQVEGARTQPADDPRQPDRRRDRVRPRAARIDTVNPGATRILRLPLSAYRGRRARRGAGPRRPSRRRSGSASSCTRASPEAGERDHWQDSFELQPAGADGRERESITLLVRGARDAARRAPDGVRRHHRARLGAALEAWSEVARRLAHEIKNPLTPIQLSAERLQHKLEPKLEGADQAMLVRSVGTIVNQVQAMKTLVNEFRDYARLPAAQLAPLDLNALVAEVLGAVRRGAGGGPAARRAGAGAAARSSATRTQLRQVIHNLVQNALDAVADRADGRVRVVHRGGAQRAAATCARCACRWSTTARASPRRCSSAPSSPTSRPRARAPASASRWSRRSPTSTARACASPTSARRRAEAGDAAGARGAQVSLSFSKLAPATAASPRRRSRVASAQAH